MTERELAARIADSHAENDGYTDVERRVARLIAAAIRALPVERCPETVFPDGTGRCALAADHGGRHEFNANLSDTAASGGRAGA